ncbi:uncharacterized protein [Penaeus vannamei]|uniref:uncharacterized protein n=1 Tax=Penaeus vannamei TaxID=6689 RepID=UPI00387F9FFF
MSRRYARLQSPLVSRGNALVSALPRMTVSSSEHLAFTPAQETPRKDRQTLLATSPGKASCPSDPERPDPARRARQGAAARNYPANEELDCPKGCIISVITYATFNYEYSTIALPPVPDRGPVPTNVSPTAPRPVSVSAPASRPISAQAPAPRPISPPSLPISPLSLLLPLDPPLSCPCPLPLDLPLPQLLPLPTVTKAGSPVRPCRDNCPV